MENIIGIDVKLLIVQLVNFFVLFIALYFILFKLVRKVVAERQQKIKGQIDEAEKLRMEAEQFRKEFEEKLRQVEEKTKQLINDAIKKGDEEKNSIIAYAREESHKLIERARAEIETERKEAMIALRKELSNMALEIAGKVISKTMDDDIHRKMVDDFVKEMEKNI